MRSGSILAGALLLAPVAAAASQDAGGMAAMMRELGGGGLRGKKLTRAIERAAAHPLGSAENPVRADGPVGQRAYLSRLRCADGTAPAFARGGSTGVGPYGYILDQYAVTCAGQAAVPVLMDMYHARAIEMRPVAGFTLADETPATT